MANKINKTSSENAFTTYLWVAAGVPLLGVLFATDIFPGLLWLSVVLLLPLLGGLGALIIQNQKDLKSRKAAYGLNSALTLLLVIGIVGVLDLLTSRYPLKWDLTKNKIHT